MSGEGCSIAEGGEANEREGEPREPKRIVVGICAMDKKVEAPPMQNILQRLQCHSYMCVVVFTDAVILHRPVEEWPLCDCLIAFYSSDFPLDKAIDYVKLRRPYVMNNLEMQYTLQNRKKVYEVLTESGVEVPRYAVLERKEGGDKVEMSETDDTVEIDGQVFNKPFVEKPLSAEDHRVYIYFPADLGGGCQQLFRKVNNRSSKFSKESTLRQSGSFIYEEFMATDGIDVKVYTVGPDYAHAEARKSPALDGRVERDLKGKEKRYPVILTPQEKIIARKVSLGFKQTVCGFDLLRANGKSYVCDVNGFSFVKNSQKYYDDCAQIVLEMITKELAPDNIPSIPPSLEYIAEDVPVPIPPAKDSLELRCVIGVIRHGDRTPKQKMKMLVTHKKFFDLFDELGGYKTGRLKLKKPKKLQRVLDIARYLLLTMDKPHNDYETEKAIHKLQQLRNVLEMYGHFSGINRKVQFKLITKKPGKDGRDRDLLLLILKWGGELTPVGERQAEELGRAFRCMYPGGEGEYASLPGSGFLRLHSTYRHDLKVYASDEGRVQMTAAAFTKGLLDLEGSFASVLVHLVKRGANATSMLDAYSHTQDRFERVKEEVHELLQSSGDVTESMLQKLAPTGAQSLVEAIKAIKNPQEACERLYSMIKELAGELKRIKQSGRQVKLCHSETMEMMLNRWGKLVKDFKLKNGTFEISKIPDIYDCIKYDLLHNSCLGLKVGKSLYSCSMHLADVVIPQEYGKTVEEKLEIASNICNPLLRKIQADLQHTIDNEYSDIIHRLDPLLSRGVVSPKRHVRTRLYFTSESHVHTLLNVLRYGEGLVESPKDSMWTTAMDKVSRSPELNYMTQIVFLLFEDTKQALNSAKRFQVEVHFSPGVKGREILLQGEDSSSVRPPDLSKALSARVLRAPVVRMAAAELHVSSMSKSSPFIGRKVSDLVTMRSSSDTTLQVLAKRKTSVDSAKSQMLSCHDMAEEDLEEQEEAGSVHSKDHIYFELEGALELAAELEAVEPLIPLCVVPLNKMDQFLCRMTGVEDDVDKAPSLLSSLGDNMFFNETVPSS